MNYSFKMNSKEVEKTVIVWNDYFFTKPVAFCAVAIIVCAFQFVVINPMETHLNSGFSKAFLSEPFRDSVISSLSISIVFGLDLILDLITVLISTKSKMSYNGFIARTLCLSSTLSFNTILLDNYGRNQPNIQLYWSLQHMHICAVLAAGLCYLHTLTPEYWTIERIILMTIFAGLSGIFSANDIYLASVTTVPGILSFICRILAFSYFSYHSIIWYKSSIRYISFKNISINQLCSIFYITLIEIGILARLILDFTNREEKFEDISLQLLTLIQYGSIAHVVLMLVVHFRVVRMNIQHTEESLEIRRQIIRYVSHELRNPMNTFTLGIGLVKSNLSSGLGRVPEAVQELLTEMLHASNTTERILDDLLIYEKLQEKEHKLDYKTVKIGPLLKDICRNNTAQSKRKGVRLMFDKNMISVTNGENRECEVKADIEKLQQVIGKLINNAIKATPRGHTVHVRSHIVPIDIATKHKLDSQGMSYLRVKDLVRIEISDMGSLHNQNFAQLSDFNIGVLQGGQGLGLGLWICKRIIDMHHGNIGIQKNPLGTGSTFFIELPSISESSAISDYVSAVSVRMAPAVRRASWLSSSTKRRRPSRLQSVVMDLGGGGASVLPSSACDNNSVDVALTIENKVLKEEDEVENSTKSIGNGVARGHKQELIRARSHELLRTRSSKSARRLARQPSSSSLRRQRSENSQFEITRVGLMAAQDIIHEVVAEDDTENVMKPPPSSPFPNTVTADRVRELGSSFWSYGGQKPVDSMDEKESSATDNFTNLLETMGKLRNSTGAHSRNVSLSSAVSLPYSVPASPNMIPNMIPKNPSRSFFSQLRANLITSKHNSISSHSWALQYIDASVDSTPIKDDKDDKNEDLTICMSNATSKGSCLIVDDVASNRKMLARLLREKFDEIEHAEDGLEAVMAVNKCLESNKRIFDIILMDFVMPNMDGPTATKQIRAMGFKGAIFGVTGNAQQRDLDYFIECGADKVFTKPVDAVDLQSSISSLRSHCL